MSAERVVLLMSGLPQPNANAMNAARLGLEAAGLVPLDLGRPPEALQAAESHDTPASVSDDAIRAFVEDHRWVLDEVDGLLVVNRSTEVVPVPDIPRQRRPQPVENMRVTNSVGRVSAAVMAAAREVMTGPRTLFVSHSLPVRVGEPTPIGLARATQDRITGVVRLAPIPLSGKVENIDLGLRTR